ncbi:MAG: hypothetical protein KDC34_20570 [Saprospiraceae bacterium]|nr:hypothetical protein [Saprospiraceae bacterium]
MKSSITFLLLATLLLQACGPTVYISPGFKSAAASHQQIALLPFDVIFTNDKIREDIPPEVVYEMESDMGYAMQDEAFSFLLNEIGKGRLLIDVQDIERTNLKLSEAGVGYYDLRNMPKEEIASLLGVDAVLSGKAEVDKPFNEVAAAAIGIVFGVWTATNSVQTTLNLHNALDGNLLWRYDYEASGSVGSSAQTLTRALMRNASKRLPY